MPFVLKACDPDDFPNLYILLEIAATLHVLFRDIVRVRAFNQHNEKAAEKARRLREMYVPWARVGFPHWVSSIASTDGAELGNGGAFQAFASRYLAAHSEFCKTFRVLSRYVSLSTFSIGRRYSR